LKNTALVKLLYKLKKSFFFCENIYKNIKPFSLITKGLEIDELPLLERFGTFCWGEIIAELRNTYKLKELISPPVSAISPV